MADYKRLVSYIYNYESGIRKRNIGFSRVESKNGQCKVTIHITASVSSMEPLKVYLFHRNGSEIEGVLLGNMIIKNGTGDFRAETTTQGLMNTDYNLEDISGVLIILNQSKFFGSQWDDEEIRIENFCEYADKKEKERLDRLVRDIQLEPQNVADMIMQDALAEQIKNNDSTETVQAAEVGSTTEETSNSVSDAMKTMVNVVQSFFQEEKRESENENTDEQDVVITEIPEEDPFADEMESAEYTTQEPYVESAELENYVESDEYSNGEQEPLSEEPVPVMQELVEAVELEENSKEDFVEEEDLTSMVAANEIEQNAEEYEQVQYESAVTEMPQEQEEQEELTATELRKECCCSEDYPECVRSLFKNFPPVKPFPKSESKNWVRIEPKDIGYLPVESWVLANNSFLLHGYYNYRHLVFGIMDVKGKQQYVIGVPGVLQSTEQTMAGMFGFHRFISAHEGENQYGSFGYWIQQIVL